MILRHYSCAEIQRVYDCPHQKVDRKPTGLWLSVVGEDDWATWCEENDFAQEWTHAYDVELAENANMLMLTTLEELDGFHVEYSRPARPTSPTTCYIDWSEVARYHDGIIIAPYQWERRLEGYVSDWYYGWDCASGCVWSAAAVSALKPLW